MFPLDVSHLGVLAVVWSAARNIEDAVPIAAAALSPPRVSSVELGTSSSRFFWSHQWAIEVSVPTTISRVVESSAVVCAKCGNFLRPHSHLTVDAFTFASGRVPVKHTVMACFACCIDFTLCWHMPFGSATVTLFTDPNAHEYFPVLARPKQASLAFITTDLLRFMTLLLGHGTASFDGMGHIWRDFWFQEAGQVVPSRLRRIFLNSWFLFETLKILHPTHHHLLEDIPMRLDRHDHDEIHFVFAKLEKMLRSHFREVYDRRHNCALCQRYRSVGVDVVQSVTCGVCAVQTGNHCDDVHDRCVCVVQDMSFVLALFRQRATHFNLERLFRARLPAACCHALQVLSLPRTPEPDEC